MMNKIYLLSILFLLWNCSSAHTTMVRKSGNSPETALKIAKDEVSRKGLKVMSVIDHSEAAKRAGLDLPPTTLLIFGNPKVGTKLMQCDQKIGIDLPLKILVWEDKKGGVFLSAEDPMKWETEYSVSGCKPILRKMHSVLSEILLKASSPPSKK